jgi:hypothetical protein
MNIETPFDYERSILAAIDAAEEVRDPLDELVEKAAGDPGAAFSPEALAELASLKSDDRAKFERVRAQLKDAGGRVTALDKAIAEESGDGGGAFAAGWRDKSTRRRAER